MTDLGGIFLASQRFFELRLVQREIAARVSFLGRQREIKRFAIKRCSLGGPTVDEVGQLIFSGIRHQRRGYSEKETGQQAGCIAIPTCSVMYHFSQSLLSTPESGWGREFTWRRYGSGIWMIVYTRFVSRIVFLLFASELGNDTPLYFRLINILDNHFRSVR